MAKKSLKNCKIVCLGGGNGMPKAVLSGMKKYPVGICAVCAMLDSGGSAGRLRKEYGITSPGDIRRAFITLANTSPAVGDLFDFRFQAGGLEGHNFANLFITALELSSKNYKTAIKEISKVLNIDPRHKVLPVTLDKSQLCAVLQDGQIIKGENNIDVPKHDSNLKIKKVYLEPVARVYRPILSEVKNADLIIIGPGDLYSSIAQILLVQGLAKAICQSKAKKIYVCNLATKNGETNDFSAIDFTAEIEKLLDCKIDNVIVNNKKIKKKGISLPVLLSQAEANKLNGQIGYKKYIIADIVSSKNSTLHDSDKLVKIILSLL